MYTVWFSGMPDMVVSPDNFRDGRNYEGSQEANKIAVTDKQ